MKSPAGIGLGLFGLGGLRLVMAFDGLFFGYPLIRAGPKKSANDLL